MCFFFFFALLFDFLASGAVRARFCGRSSGVIYCYGADGCDDGGSDSESAVG